MGDGGVSKGILQSLAPASRKSLSEEVRDRLREAIVRGRFEPGSRLSESELAEAFGVSRGPVREALSGLQQEGLVHLQRHKAARVSEISKEDVAELYELRKDLERFAVKRAVRLATAEELAEMGTVAAAYGLAVKGGAVQEAVDLDMRFHDLIYEAARHARLRACWTSLLRSQIHAFVLSSSLVDPGYMVPCVPEHAAIRDALRARDKEGALRLVDLHLDGAFERLLERPLEEI